jgi:Rrf2 family protein
MYITREADYAMRCVLVLAKENGRMVNANQIARSASVPKSFLSKILQRLSKKGVVESAQGSAGGFVLARHPGKISLYEVIEAVQEPYAVNRCAVSKRACKRSARCAIHTVWIDLRQEIEKRLKSQNFADLARKEKRLAKEKLDRKAV